MVYNDLAHRQAIGKSGAYDSKAAEHMKKKARYKNQKKSYVRDIIINIIANIEFQVKNFV